MWLRNRLNWAPGLAQRAVYNKSVEMANDVHAYQESYVACVQVKDGTGERSDTGYPTVSLRPMQFAVSHRFQRY